jgi:hypothetical protein
MATPCQFDSARWLALQRFELPELLDSALGELEPCRINVRAGSFVSPLNSTEGGHEIQVLPNRYAPCHPQPLALSLRATTYHGPPRYEVWLSVSGDEPSDAVRRLGVECADEWRAILREAGLWLVSPDSTERLTSPEQLVAANSPLSIVAAFLRFDTPRAGLMLLGTLYRATLDEITGAGRMQILCNRLRNGLGGRLPSMRRSVQPLPAQM